MIQAPESEFEYIVVGSGAGGGTIAARLVEAGRRVLVIESGPDPLAFKTGRARDDYQVPVFHALASENEDMAWHHYVSHFDDPAEAAQDAKLGPAGILYPRAGAFGGCTAHNAMIFLPPPDDDWDHLAGVTGDAGWSAEAMRRHRAKVEQCRHRPVRRLLAGLGLNTTGHGWAGWLPVEMAIPVKAFADALLLRTLFLSAMIDLVRDAKWRTRLRAFLLDWGDPNDVTRAGVDQLCYLPIATRRHARFGTRERLADTADRYPDRLSILTDTHVTGLIFDAQGRVTGVDWLTGRHLYRACPRPATLPGTAGLSHATCEVILAGGAFATPQLLKLSGIGDREELSRHGLATRVHLPQVGCNLQDRYEIAVVNRMKTPWKSMAGARFEAGDPLYSKWKRFRCGMYTSNGAAIAALRRSGATSKNPDLILMGLLGRFKGYFPGYARETWLGLDALSWTILKGSTANRAGTVTLASADPLDPPVIAFRNFADGGDADLDALVEGVEMARALSAPLIACGAIATEETPGAALQGRPLRNWVRANAWGHHACGTAAIGPVLDAQCRVIGIEGLRVVDASIFPRIPGLFIVAAIYMAAEKVASDILEGR